MNPRQLEKLGVPRECSTAAIVCITSAAKAGKLKGLEVETLIPKIVAAPNDFKEHEFFGGLALDLIEAAKIPVVRSVPYQVWGREGIDDNTIDQMNKACTLPSAVGAALMPDAHVGYGLPIGGVLGLDNAVCPYAVGVDIACRMKLSVLDANIEDLENASHFESFRDSIEKGSKFGVGQEYGRSGRQKHGVMDDPRWEAVPLLERLKDTAWSQLGTSGSGNHFVEYGRLTIWEKNQLGLEPGKYVALLSHSGSRGTGSKVCDYYSKAAQDAIPRRLQELYPRLGWLTLDSELGQEYWTAMNLMGDYAAANHDVIHRNVAKFLGAKIIAGVENHHNFAWKETHGGKEMIVHRKGATPAGMGVLGVIPGSMATPAYVVSGLGVEASLGSASHGAGRVMSRKQANNTYNFNAVKKDLEVKGVRILSAGADEVPYVYKNIDEVMARQSDLVKTIARFDPRIVKMSGDGKSED